MGKVITSFNLDQQLVKKLDDRACALGINRSTTAQIIMGLALGFYKEGLDLDKIIHMEQMKQLRAKKKEK